MRIFSVLLAIALLAAWGHAAPARAQCDPSVCSGAAKAKTAKAAKQAAAKAKKPKDEYMKAAP